MSNSVQGSNSIASIRKVNFSKEKLNIDANSNGAAMQDSRESIGVERNQKMSLVDDDFSPLSGIAYYKNVVTQSNLKPLYQMVFGVRAHKYLPSQLASATVTCRGKTWEMMFLGNKVNKMLDIASWRDFIIVNKLKVGDALFWDVMESEEDKVSFRVQIIKGHHRPMPSSESEMEGGSDGDGETRDNPIVID